MPSFCSTACGRERGRLSRTRNLLVTRSPEDCVDAAIACGWCRRSFFGLLLGLVFVRNKGPARSATSGAREGAASAPLEPAERVGFRYIGRDAIDTKAHRSHRAGRGKQL